ncbi:unnamed protein product [Xyrichtys novacula]|uniref:Unnamed protein product n=1 Tax=Xyrichtys novacula TaxID=13765 RepID=A0AAV1FPL9_XYRNO|nr:unnamed protein product [Xyrichtys novacula]
METPNRNQSSRGSPVSPEHARRLQEKKDLSKLNDRLAEYIDKVGSLEVKNTSLHEEIKELESTNNRKLEKIKEKLEDTQRTLNKVDRERARLEVELSNLRKEYNELEASDRKNESDLAAARTLLSSKEADLTRTQREKRALEAEVKDLKVQLAKLEGSLADAKRQLQDEMLRRVDAENRLQTVKEELEFQKNIHAEEQRESQRRIESLKDEITKIKQEEYECKLAEAVDKLRAEHKENLRRYKEEKEKTLNSKVRDLEDKLERMQRQLDKKDRKIDELESQKKQLEEQFRGLQDIKLALDNELSTYKKLLDKGEESLSPSPERRSQGMRTPGSGRGCTRHLFSSGVSPPNRCKSCGSPIKRSLSDAFSETSSMAGDYGDFTRTSHRATARRFVTVAEVDLMGKFIRLSNMGDKDQSLHNWQVKRQAGGRTPMVYKFPPKFSLRAGGSVTIWAASGGGTNNPPTDLVWRNQDSWGTGDHLLVTLINASGEEMARRSVTRRTVSRDNSGDDSMEVPSTSGAENEYNLRSRGSGGHDDANGH